MSAIGKPDLISAIAKESHIDKMTVQKVFETTLETLKKTFQEGQEVRLIGFGTFAVQELAAREGRNPRTGETLKIAAAKKVSFKMGKELKEALNSGK